MNTAQVDANRLIGREIVEEEQRGASRATDGKKLVEDLTQRFGAEYGIQDFFLGREFPTHRVEN